jgi:hypothetical protein
LLSLHHLVAIYKSRAEAEAAVKELERSGGDMEKLAIVGRDCPTEGHVVGYYNRSQPLCVGDRLAAEPSILPLDFACIRAGWGDIS